jgi:hypothetical protein
MPLSSHNVYNARALRGRLSLNPRTDATRDDVALWELLGSVLAILLAFLIALMSG